MGTVHFTLHAQRLLSSGKTSDAISVLEEGLKVYPEYATAYALLARAYVQLLDVPTAFEIVTNAVHRFPYHRGLELLHKQLHELLQSDKTLSHVVEPLPAPEPTDASSIDQTDYNGQQDSNEPECEAPVESLRSQSESHTQPDAWVPCASDRQEGLSPATSIGDLDSTEHTQHVQAEEFSVDIPLDGEQTPSPEECTLPQDEPRHEESHSTTTESGDTTDDEKQSDTAPTMRIVETATIDSRAMRMLRSSNIRLIPGLEFAPLRIESKRRALADTAFEFPPFRSIRGSQRNYRIQKVRATANTLELLDNVPRNQPHREVTQSNVAPQPRISLDELAQQLENVRIQPQQNPKPIEPRGRSVSDEPTVVSETMAHIYESQGAIEQAIKAYMTLARQFPERRAYFEEKIAQLRTKQ